jgi:hypothetical protein
MSLEREVPSDRPTLDRNTCVRLGSRNRALALAFALRLMANFGPIFVLSTSFAEDLLHIGHFGDLDLR